MDDEDNMKVVMDDVNDNKINNTITNIHELNILEDEFFILENKEAKFPLDLHLVQDGTNDELNKLIKNPYYIATALTMSVYPLQYSSKRASVTAPIRSRGRGSCFPFTPNTSILLKVAKCVFYQ